MVTEIHTISNIGVVVIGRNEGERLKGCLESIINHSNRIVYVDSGSIDNSLTIASKMGVLIVELDMSIPFTAARARNEGFNLLMQTFPDTEFVQFVDGDCVVFDRWLETAVNFLNKHKQVAVVCGRRRERYPEASMYNALCDIEWNTPVGEAKACGGDAMMRTSVVEQVNGYNPAVIAGEEPEMCVRIRHAGWNIWRLDADMTLHDADMHSFRQWWRRSSRGGFAYAMGAAMHGKPPERHWVVESRRAKIWAIFIPAAILLAASFQPVYLTLFLIYPAQIARIALNNKEKISRNWLYAFFLTMAKFPEITGQVRYYLGRLTKKQHQIIEYKN